MTIEEEIVDTIMQNLLDRKGIKQAICEIDEDTCNEMHVTLAGLVKEKLKQKTFLEPGKWVDVDIAMCQMLQTLGLLSNSDNFGGCKWVFWTNNPLGNACTEFLFKLMELKILEENPDESQVRVPENYNPEKLNGYKE